MKQQKNRCFEFAFNCFKFKTVEGGDENAK